MNLSTRVGLLFLVCRCHGPAQTPLPAELAPFFAPPPAFTGQFGHYRSPLLFDDGSAVKTAADWTRRRAEILRYWHAVMGPWPPLLAKPRLEVVNESEREGLRWRRVRIEIAADRFEEGWLLAPARRGPFPAVLVPFYEPETSVGLGRSEFRDYGLQLARRGFVTLSIGSPGGDARRPDPGRTGWQPLSFLAYVAANGHAVLAQQPDVDPARIGIVGHSYGGKWAMFAACLHERFAAGAWSDPGLVFDEARSNVNYWEPWYLGRDDTRPQPRRPGMITPDNPRTGAYQTLREAGRDLHELHALMAPRPFLVSGGSEDPAERWLALNHSLAVNQLLGMTNRVAMTNRPEHSPNAEANEVLLRFFEFALGTTTRK